MRLNPERQHIGLNQPQNCTSTSNSDCALRHALQKLLSVCMCRHVHVQEHNMLEAPAAHMAGRRSGPLWPVCCCAC